MATSRKTDDQIAASTAVTSGLVTQEELDSGKAIVEADAFSRDELAGISSFQDAMALATSQYGGVIQAHDDPNLGTGFRIATEDDKYRLQGVPLLLLDWRFNEGDFAEDYVSIHAIQQEESGKAVKWVINDGGTGICKDLREYTVKTNRKGGVFLRRGLRVSEYPTDVDSGLPLSKSQEKEYIRDGRKVGKGKTFYLDFSA
jgi:hypothetical protein